MNFVEIKAQLQPILAARPEVRLAYLFGSAVYGRMNKLSDIDVAVLVDQEHYEAHKSAFRYEIGLINDLTGALHTDQVDLVILNKAPPLLANQVISQGQLIFCRDERERIAFEVETKKRYLDTKPLRELKRHYLYKRIEEGRFSEVKLPSSTGK